MHRSNTVVLDVDLYLSRIREFLARGDLYNAGKTYDLAFGLYRQTSTPPRVRCARASFISEAGYFEYLAQYPHDLFIHLMFDLLTNNLSGIASRQDENGMTLLHHAAQSDLCDTTRLVLFLLLKHPGLDIARQDKEGDTALHYAAACCSRKFTREYIFPRLLSAAARQGFNFDLLNSAGQSVLHIAARVRCADDFASFDRANMMETILRHVPGINLNVLSSSGSTAFFYCIRDGFLQEAMTLLNAGANPLLCGNADRNPLLKLRMQMAMLAMNISNLQFVHDVLKRDYDRELQDRLEEIKSGAPGRASSDGIQIRIDFKRRVEELADFTQQIDRCTQVMTVLAGIQARIMAYQPGGSLRPGAVFPFWQTAAAQPAVTAGKLSAEKSPILNRIL